MTSSKTPNPYANVLLDAYFSRTGGPEAANPLVRHQVESFNDFLDRKMHQVIQGFHPIIIQSQYDATREDFLQKLNITMKNPTIAKPIYQHQDGSQIIMTPNIARLNNLTYAANMHVDIHLVSEMINQDGILVREEKALNSVCIGKIPIMVRSKACILTQAPLFCESGDKTSDECRYDPGGYFIVHGNEKVIISQDRISENQALIFPPNAASDGLTIEIRSVPDGSFLPPKTTALHMSGKANHLGYVIRITTHYIRQELPLFVLFRALGIESDKDILQHIMLDVEDEKIKRVKDALMASLEDSSDILTQEDALAYISRYLSISGIPKEHIENPVKQREVLMNMLHKDFLPHVGPELRRKALYLGYMTRKLVMVHLGYLPYDNRDSYIHKRIDTPGVLIANLFRQCVAKVVKELRTALQRDLNNWRASPHTPSPIHLIHTTNIHKFLKPTIIESSLRYALSTGNWGVKSANPFGNVRQGVAQVLNRMSYMSTLSHFRRINTPMEKSGKLVQPRKLDNSQYGTICIAETPEGSSVGLVKNMAITTHISIATSSMYLRQELIRLGVQIYNDSYNKEESRDFLKRMSEPTTVMIQLNGDILGYHTVPNELYWALKNLKWTGRIPATTSISWDIPMRLILLSTEAGRMYRPLMVVEDNELRAQKYKLLPNDLDKMTFTECLAPLTSDAPHAKGFLEYLDVEEMDKAMIAMSPHDLNHLRNPTEVIPSYTHCEIDPCVMLGVLASMIPFMNHNQSPRNCYQAAMGKQAVSLFATNFNQRFDTMGHVLNYPQRPLAQTTLSRHLNGNVMGSGINCMVAIMTYSGFNQEDSVMINKAALDRGLFCSTYYKTFRDVCSKNHSTGEEEVFVNPDPTNTTGRKPYNYDKLAPNGLCPKDTYMDQNDIMVGKMMPQKVNGKVQYKDTSVPMKPNENGWIDRNYNGVNAEGYPFVKIRMREYRKPTVGDKLASRHAQKGTCGMIYQQQDMPFTKDGISPDIIMNPHAIPSRMTIGQLLECIMGKAACCLGSIGDATPFRDCSVEDIAKILEANGIERYGNEVLYDGRTGRQLQTEIFIGPTYYQRLKHMVCDKQHSRGSNGPVVMLTRQPAEGRARNGGLRFGEMERDCLSTEHQVLTNKGFLFLPEMENALKNDPDIKIASYNTEKKELVYEKCNELIVKPATEQKLVEFTCQAEDFRWNQTSDPYGQRNKDEEWDGTRSNGVSLCVTQGHDMYVRTGRTALRGSVWYNDYHKVKAKDIVGSQNVDVVKFLCHAEGGAKSTGEDIQILQKYSQNREAFLQLYGYWLGDGSLLFKAGGGRDTVHFSIVKKQDQEWIEHTCKEIGLTYTKTKPNKRGEIKYDITTPEVVEFFHQEYRHRYPSGDPRRKRPTTLAGRARGAKKICTDEPLPIMDLVDVSSEDSSTMVPEGIKSAKWFASWVWKLGKTDLRNILVGLRKADGTEKSDKNRIYTSSARFRDEIIRVCLHAGYSATFHLLYAAGTNRGNRNGRDIVANHDAWVVIYRDCAQFSAPTLHRQRDIKEVPYNDKTWCVSVPSGFIVTRRAHANESGVVLKASVPTILGNCILAHGSSTFLKERMMDASDNYRVFVCRNCGLLATANPEKNIFFCKRCKMTDISQVRIPYACKLLFQELECMNIAARIQV